MKYLLVLLACLSSQIAFAGTSLLERYPHQESFILSDGTRVLLPVHQRDADFAGVIGVADLSSLNRELADQDLVAVESPIAPGKGTVVIYVIDYRDGDAGPYREVMSLIQVAPKDTPALAASAAALSKPAYFIWDIRVTTQLPLAFGVEVWGYPKRLAKISLARRGDDFEFSLRDGAFGRTPVFAGKCVGCATGVQEIENDLYFVTPYSPRRTWARTMTRGLFAFKPFDPSAGDRFELSRGIIAKKLKRVGFAPALWTTGLSVEAVGFKDRNTQE